MTFVQIIPLVIALSGFLTVFALGLPLRRGDGGSGIGLSAAVTFLPSDLPTTHWHLTARPWAALNIPASSYLTRGNNLTSWYVQNTNTNGCLNNPAAQVYTTDTNTNAANGAVGWAASYG